ncbi:alpha/beta fold hydrolase [Henriciella litoralis]|uniref:alpha/beta fold hydrolase n=1 Tax=Henriciella litoralis TaxID=568102 RepID=UPI000A02E150|nr:alpha/beta hydrolase [Henriciella litoralis]
MSERREFIADDGVGLVADIAGPSDGPTILLAHGGGQTRHSWSHAVSLLAGAGYCVINLDARGHGESGWSPDNRYPLERRWSDMAGVIAEQTGPIGVVGASMGGGTALFGLTHSYRPNALVLVDIAPNSERAGMQRVRDFMASGVNGFASLEEAAAAIAAYNPSRKRPASVSGLKRKLRQRDNGRWYWHWDPGMLEIDIDEERAKMAETFDALKSATSVPVLLVRGLESDVVTERTVDEFKARIPDIEVADVSGAGHMVAGDRNDAFNDAVLGFLRRHMPPSAS